MSRLPEDARLDVPNEVRKEVQSANRDRSIFLCIRFIAFPIIGAALGGCLAHGLIDTSHEKLVILGYTPLWRAVECILRIRVDELTFVSVLKLYCTIDGAILGAMVAVGLAIVETRLYLRHVSFACGSVDSQLARDPRYPEVLREMNGILPAVCRLLIWYVVWRMFVAFGAAAHMMKIWRE